MRHFFLPRSDGQRLCVYHAPGTAGALRAAVVHVPAFGEEMNKSRHMVARQCRAFAQAGCATLQIDLLGCGDSSGDHGDATWDAWLADVRTACDWLEERHPGVPLWLWGQRCGALLAALAVAGRPGATRLLLWQPMVAGRTLVQQLQRLRMAAHLGDPVKSKQAMATLREDLAQGRSVDIAGYTVSAALMQSLEAATLIPPDPRTPVYWLELAARADAELAPVSRRTIDDWRAAGISVQAAVVEGPTFWQATEIEHAPGLIEATLWSVVTDGGGGT